MLLGTNEVIIHEGNYTEFLNPVVDGEQKMTGLIPRDYSVWPVGCYESITPYHAVDLTPIPQSDWSAMIKEMEQTKSRLSDLRMTGNKGAKIPSLDQNGKGYCWAHSTTGALMMTRVVMNEPYVPLSAYAVACIIKNYADEGGWGALSLDFAIKRGVPSQAFWPQQSMSKSNDNADTWANAALHKVSAGWIDLQAAVYDRTMTFAQVMTLLLCRVPVIADFNWWSHSVCLLDPVEVEPGSFGVRILNSWGDSWSDNGMGVLQGKKAIPDGAVAPRLISGSLV